MTNNQRPAARAKSPHLRIVTGGDVPVSHIDTGTAPQKATQAQNGPHPVTGRPKDAWRGTPHRHLVSLTKNSTLRDAISQFLRHVEVLAHNNQRAPGTLRRLRHELARVAPELHPSPNKRRRSWRSLGGVRLDALTTVHVLNWFEDVQDHTTNASAVQSLAALRTVLYWVRRRGLLATNPAANLGLTHESAPGEPLTPKELAALRRELDTAEARLVDWYATRRNPLARVGAASSVQSIRVLELTGARLEEVTAMRVVEVQLAAGCILRRETKSGPRAIPLGEEAIELLDQQLRRLAGRFEFVFPSPARPTAPISGSAVEKLFRGLCSQIGLKRHVHDLRHTWAWLALWSGETIEALSVAMGHASIEVTRKVYGRHNKITPQSRQVARAVERARHSGEVADVAA